MPLKCFIGSKGLNGCIFFFERMNKLTLGLWGVKLLGLLIEDNLP
jgi:hypothetical protein